MNGAMKEKRLYWIGGTVTGFLGVALVRILSPELAGIPGLAAGALGYALVIAGITIIGCATRRRQAEAFVTTETGAADPSRHDRAA